MNTRWSFATTAFALMFAVSASAQSTTVGSVCKDGSNDATVGRGACARHGGVDKAATTKAQAAAKASVKTNKTTAAAGAAATVSCKDGSTSKSGQGACAHHGGVASAAGNVAANTAKTKSVVSKKPAASATASTAASATTKSSKSSNSKNTDPTGATALCKDGTYSHAKTHTGACGHHGGVSKWM